MECPRLVSLTFSVYTSSAPLSQSEFDLDLFPAPGTGPLTLSAWQNIFPRYSPLAVFSRSCTGIHSFLRVKHVLCALCSARAHNNGRSISRQTSGFSVILTGYVNKWSEKKKHFRIITFQEDKHLFYFMCFLLVRLVRSSYYRSWLGSREPWLSYNFSGRSIQSATVQRPCCHDDGERSIYFRSVVKRSFQSHRKNHNNNHIKREPNFSVMVLYRCSRRSFEHSNRTSVYLLHYSGKAFSPRPSQPCC